MRWELWQSCVGARLTDRQTGVPSLLGEHPRSTSWGFVSTLHWAFRTHQTDLESQTLQSRNQRAWQSTRLFLFKNDIIDCPDNSNKLISVDTQSKSPASSMDSADPNATLFSSLLLKKEKNPHKLQLQICRPASLPRQGKKIKLLRSWESQSYR